MPDPRRRSSPAFGTPVNHYERETFMQCDENHKGKCKGEVTEGPSRSGASVYQKCDNGWDEYDQRMDKVHADISSRYPGYDVPGSPPPPGFDPDYAGERWDDDY